MANCLPAQPLQTTCCPTENASRLFSKGNIYRFVKECDIYGICGSLLGIYLLKETNGMVGAIIFIMYCFTAAIFVNAISIGKSNSVFVLGNFGKIYQDITRDTRGNIETSKNTQGTQTDESRVKNYIFSQTTKITRRKDISVSKISNPYSGNMSFMRQKKKHGLKKAVTHNNSIQSRKTQPESDKQNATRAHDKSREKQAENSLDVIDSSSTISCLSDESNENDVLPAEKATNNTVKEAQCTKDESHNFSPTSLSHAMLKEPNIDESTAKHETFASKKGLNDVRDVDERHERFTADQDTVLTYNGVQPQTQVTETPQELDGEIEEIDRSAVSSSSYFTCNDSYEQGSNIEEVTATIETPDRIKGRRIIINVDERTKSSTPNLDVPSASSDFQIPTDKLKEDDVEIDLLEKSVSFTSFSKSSSHYSLEQEPNIDESTAKHETFASKKGLNDVRDMDERHESFTADHDTVLPYNGVQPQTQVTETPQELDADIEEIDRSAVSSSSYSSCNDLYQHGSNIDETQQILTDKVKDDVAECEITEQIRTDKINEVVAEIEINMQDTTFKLALNKYRSPYSLKYDLTIDESTEIHKTAAQKRRTNGITDIEKIYKSLTAAQDYVLHHNSFQDQEYIKGLDLFTGKKLLEYETVSVHLLKSFYNFTERLYSGTPGKVRGLLVFVGKPQLNSLIELFDFLVRSKLVSGPIEQEQEGFSRGTEFYSSVMYRKITLYFTQLLFLSIRMETKQRTAFDRIANYMKYFDLIYEGEKETSRLILLNEVDSLMKETVLDGKKIDVNGEKIVQDVQERVVDIRNKIMHNVKVVEKLHYQEDLKTYSEDNPYFSTRRFLSALFEQANNPGPEDLDTFLGGLCVFIFNLYSRKKTICSKYTPFLRLVVMIMSACSEVEIIPLITGLMESVLFNWNDFVKYIQTNSAVEDGEKISFKLAEYQLEYAIEKVREMQTKADIKTLRMNVLDPRVFEKAMRDAGIMPKQLHTTNDDLLNYELYFPSGCRMVVAVPMQPSKDTKNTK